MHEDHLVNSMRNVMDIKIHIELSTLGCVVLVTDDNPCVQVFELSYLLKGCPKGNI